MTEIAGKVWGETRRIFSKCNVEIHRIDVIKGGICSKHRHVHKANAFYVERGQLAVDVWKSDYPLVDRTILFAGDIMTVAPGEYHRFEALLGTVAYEIYFVELDPSDIEREDCGKGGGPPRDSRFSRHRPLVAETHGALVAAPVARE